MATTSTTNPASIAYAMQTYFSRKLLDYIRPVLVLAQFGSPHPLPKSQGSMTMRMFRYGSPSIAAVKELAEGVPIAEAEYRELTMERIEVPLKQYGQVVAITDILDDIGLFNDIEQAVKTNGEDAALKCDTVIRNELAIYANADTGGAGDGYVDYTRKSLVYAQAATTYAGVYNGGTASANYVLTAADLLDAATALKVASCPRIANYYVAAAAPQVTRDLMEQDDVWQRVSTYSDREQIYMGEIGKIFGVRVVETTNPFRAGATQGTFSSTGTVFSTFVFGRDTYGVPALEGNSPHSPRVTVVKGADKSDPLNQIAAKVGFKTTYAAKLLQPYWLAEIYSQSGFAVA